MSDDVLLPPPPLDKGEGRLRGFWKQIVLLQRLAHGIVLEQPDEAIVAVDLLLSHLVMSFSVETVLCGPSHLFLPPLSVGGSVFL
ncbi:MAG: hypothetical protein ACLP5H_10730 [Desulfomonilaceae bacterium]